MGWWECWAQGRRVGSEGMVTGELERKRLCLEAKAFSDLPLGVGRHDKEVMTSYGHASQKFSEI